MEWWRWMKRRFLIPLFWWFFLSGAWSQPLSDSTDYTLADSIDFGDVLEEQFLQDIDSLNISLDDFGIDTFAWSNERINSGRFDSEKWSDTARIHIVDSANNRFYVHPYDSCVTSNFGPRRWFWHFGVDIKTRHGDTILVALDGIVRVTQYDRRGYGNVVVVRHHNGLETIYGHLSKILVSPNERLKAGDALGLAGNTGHSTGSHLHFEWRYFGEPFDPNLIVDFANRRLKSDTLVLTRTAFEYLVELRKIRWHTIRKGETLSSIARRYRTTVKSLCKLNNISPRTILRVGRKIIVGRTRKHESPVVYIDTVSRSNEKNVGGGGFSTDDTSTHSSVLTTPVIVPPKQSE